MRILLLTFVCGLLAGATAARAQLGGSGGTTVPSRQAAAEPTDQPATPNPRTAPANSAAHGAEPAASALPSNPAEHASAPASCATPAEGPCLRLEHATHDFGDVSRRSENLTHDFPFVNDGSKPLVITRVLTSCSCLKAAFPKRPVPPGQGGTIRITYEPFKSEPGAFNKVIQIYSNSADGREILTVQGNSIDLKNEPKPRNLRLKFRRNQR